MSARVDWTTTEGCARCDEHGPFLSDAQEAARNAHQAWHAISAEMLKALHIPQLAYWLARRMSGVS